MKGLSATFPSCVSLGFSFLPKIPSNQISKCSFEELLSIVLNCFALLPPGVGEVIKGWDVGVNGNIFYNSRNFSYIVPSFYLQIEMNDILIHI